MIAFGCAISEAEPYLRYAAPGIELAKEPGSEVFAFAAVDTLARSHNILLDAAAARSELEALVLVSPYAELTDPQCAAKIRRALSDPKLAVAGCVGARGVSSIAWWEGSQVSCASGFRYLYDDHGGGELAGLPWVTCGPAPAEVDVVDGSVLVLSRWAVENLRFDEALSRGHGIDVDYCLQARAAGRTVATIDVSVAQRRPLNIIGDLEVWTEAHVDFGRKWMGKIPGSPPVADYREQARRLEAEREAARSMSYFKRLAYDARLEPLERELQAATQTLSWRITEPLRRYNKRRQDAAASEQDTARGAPRS
jgi:hypothetical protein